MIHLSNFSIKHLPIYKEAIHRLGDPRIRIGVDSHTLLPNRGLYFEGSQPNLTEFWKVYDEVRFELGMIED